jgi:hypothetical protein
MRAARGLAVMQTGSARAYTGIERGTERRVRGQ